MRVCSCSVMLRLVFWCFFFQAEDGIRDYKVTGVQTCALPIWIVNMGSQAGAVALPGESVYCMTKAAIAHLTRCLAVEWGQHGINVNCVAPTFIRTPGTEEALADADFEADVVERIAALHRIGEPMDVAGAVLYLCSPAAALVTGHTLMVDGGWTAR